MRDIKFRAWDKVNKRFDYWTVQPVKIVEDDGHLYNHGMQLLHRAHGLPLTKKEIDAEAKKQGQADYEDFNLTTGLKDKNGKEIYEGDIIFDPPGYPDDKGRNMIVRFGDMGDGRQGFWLDGCLSGSFIGVFQSNEVIGNIYENTELLK